MSQKILPRHLLKVILDAMRDGAEDVGEEMALRVYKAISEELPIYEDVYDQCCGLIEPYVERPGKPGFLPGSVVDSLSLLLKKELERRGQNN